MIKKHSLIIFTFLFVIVFLMSNSFAFAAGSSYIESPWIYQINSNEVIIVGYTGNSKNCYIPWELAGIEVKKVSKIDNSNIKTLYVPNNSVTISQEVADAVNEICFYNLVDDIPVEILYGDKFSNPLIPSDEVPGEFIGKEDKIPSENDNPPSIDEEKLDDKKDEKDSPPHEKLDDKKDENQSTESSNISNTNNLNKGNIVNLLVGNRYVVNEMDDTIVEEVEITEFEEKEDDPFKEDAYLSEEDEASEDKSTNVVIIFVVAFVIILTFTFIFLKKKNINKF